MATSYTVNEFRKMLNEDNCPLNIDATDTERYLRGDMTITDVLEYIRDYRVLLTTRSNTVISEFNILTNRGHNIKMDGYPVIYLDDIKFDQRHAVYKKCALAFFTIYHQDIRTVITELELCCIPVLMRDMIGKNIISYKSTDDLSEKIRLIHPSSSEKISIIMPIYNDSKHIRNTLESILRYQYYRNVEVIVINDGSTDKSANIIQDYITFFSNLILVHNDKRRGIPYSYNRGLKIHTGKYYCMMTGNTILPPRRLLDDILTFNRYPNVLVVQSLLVQADNTTHRVLNCEYSPICMTMKNTIFEKIGYLTDLPCDGYNEYERRIKVVFSPFVFIRLNTVGYIDLEMNDERSQSTCETQNNLEEKLQLAHEMTSTDRITLKKRYLNDIINGKVYQKFNP